MEPAPFARRFVLRSNYTIACKCRLSSVRRIVRYTYFDALSWQKALGNKLFPLYGGLRKFSLVSHVPPLRGSMFHLDMVPPLPWWATFFRP
jgi:hypothetical protein